MVAIHGKSLPLPRLRVTTRHGNSPPWSPLLRSPPTGKDSPLFFPCPLSVSPSVRPPPPAPSVPPPRQPSHRRGGRGGEGPPAETPALGEKHHRCDRLSRHTAAYGRSVGRPLPCVSHPVSPATPSLALPRPPHAAVHHLEPLALRRPPHAAGHHLERSDIRNNRPPRHHVSPRPVTGATENSPCDNGHRQPPCSLPKLWTASSLE